MQGARPVSIHYLSSFSFLGTVIGFKALYFPVLPETAFSSPNLQELQKNFTMDAVEKANAERQRRW
jgi:hypothetical protein